MTTEFLKAIAALDETTEAFKAGRVLPWPHSQARGAALCQALVAMAASLGADIEDPITIDSRGELRCVSKQGTTGKADRASFGAEFARWLNTASPRTGVAPGAVMLPESSWCYLNHFSVEKLVQAYAHDLASTQPTLA